MMLDEIRLTIVVVMRNGKFLEKNLKAESKDTAEESDVGSRRRRVMAFYLRNWKEFPKLELPFTGCGRLGEAGLGDTLILNHL